MKGRAAWGVLLILLLLSAPFASVAAPSTRFSFLNTMTLRQGQSFSIWARTPGMFGTSLRRVGRGSIAVLTPYTLRFRFQASILTRDISGDVSIQYTGTSGGDLKFLLAYSGKENDRKESSRETVRVDSFLAEKGIVSFHYHKSQRFLQLSRSSSGENKFVTDWGAATLRRD